MRTRRRLAEQRLVPNVSISHPVGQTIERQSYLESQEFNRGFFVMVSSWLSYFFTAIVTGDKNSFSPLVDCACSISMHFSRNISIIVSIITNQVNQRSRNACFCVPVSFSLFFLFAFYLEFIFSFMQSPALIFFSNYSFHLGTDNLLPPNCAQRGGGLHLIISETAHIIKSSRKVHPGPPGTVGGLINMFLLPLVCSQCC